MKRVIVLTGSNASFTFSDQCAKDCVTRGEAPIVFTRLTPIEKEWFYAAQDVIVYSDYGTDSCISESVEFATKIGLGVKFRSLYETT